MTRHLILVAVLVSVALPAAADQKSLTDILKMRDYAAMCTGENELTPHGYVDPDTLAELTVKHFDIPSKLLRSANPDAIPGQYSERLSLAYAFAVYQNDDAEIGRPCDIKGNKNSPIQHCEAFGSQDQTRWAENEPDLFRSGLKNLAAAYEALNTNFPSNSRYKYYPVPEKFEVKGSEIHRTPVSYFAQITESMLPIPENNQRTDLQVVCLKTAPEASDQDEKSDDFKILVALKPEDLTKDRGPDDIKEIDSASLSFEGDRRAKSTSMSVNGTIGFKATQDEITFGEQEEIDGKTVPARPFRGAFDLFPYATYKLSAIDSPNEDERIHLLEPGFLAAGLLQLGHPNSSKQVTADSLVALSTTMDLENGSKVLNLRTSFAPQFAIDNTKSFPPDTFFSEGPVTLEPIAKLLFNTRYVLAASSNENLKNGGEYGLGGEAGLEFYFPSFPLLTESSIGVSYTHLEIFSGAIEEAKRFEAKAEYAPFNDAHLVLKFSYVDGRDLSTYQKEQTWEAGLGVRY